MARTWDPNKPLVQDWNPATQSSVKETPILSNASAGSKTSTASLVDASKKYAGNPLTAPAPTVPEPVKTAAELEAETNQAAMGLVEKEMTDVNKVATDFGLQEGPSTIQEAVDKFKTSQAAEKSALEKQLAAQKTLDDAAAARFNEQAAGSIAATSAAFAQGREGAIAGGAAGLRNEFTAEMNKRISENKVKLEAQQAQRDEIMRQLDEAQRSGQTKMADQLSRSLGAAKVQIEETKTAYINALTQANEEARLAEQSTRQNVTTFTGMVDSGAVMTPQGIASMAATLNVPFNVAYDYYQSAEQVRQDKSLSLEEKQIKLSDLKFGFDEKIQGIRGEQAQAVSDFQKLAKSGNYTQAQLATFATAMNIPNEMNPLYQSEVKLKAAEATMKDFEARYIDGPPPAGSLARLQYDKAKLELQIAQAENFDYTGNLPEDAVKSAFYQDGPSDYGHGEGRRECGEGYNDITEGTKVADSYESKMATVTKRDNPQIGNGLIIPLRDAEGSLKYGHIETVIETNPLADTIKTVSWNRDGNGTETIQTYKVSDLQRMYGENWGFSDSKLKPEYLSKLEETKLSSGTSKYADFYRTATSNGMPPKEAKAWAQKQTETALEQGEMTALPDEYSWAGTIIENTFGDAEGGKSSARKQEQLAKAIESGNGREAKNIVYNAILENVSPTERKAFGDALTLKDSYEKLDSAIRALESANLDTGFVGGNLNEMMKALKQARPQEAVTLDQRLTDAFNQYRKAITGAGASTQELEMLKGNMPTFDKNLSDIKYMVENLKRDATDSLNRDVEMYSKGAFSSYPEMQDKLDDLSGKKRQQQETIQGFLNLGRDLISGYQEETGKYVVPEEHPALTFEF